MNASAFFVSDHQPRDIASVSLEAKPDTALLDAYSNAVIAAVNRVGAAVVNIEATPIAGGKKGGGSGSVFMDSRKRRGSWW